MFIMAFLVIVHPTLSNTSDRIPSNQPQEIKDTDPLIVLMTLPALDTLADKPELAALVFQCPCPSLQANTYVYHVSL